MVHKSWATVPMVCKQWSNTVPKPVDYPLTTTKLSEIERRVSNGYRIKGDIDLLIDFARYHLAT